MVLDAETQRCREQILLFISASLRSTFTFRSGLKFKILHSELSVMPKAKYKKHNMTYSITGEGPTVVFLHGFGEDRRMWKEYIQAFTSYQIITIDLPGFGQSEVLSNATIPVMAEVVKTVLDQEAIKQCILIGHSMGGYVTLNFAHHFPNRLLGFGLFHSHPYADTADRKVNRIKSIDFVKEHGVPFYLKQLMPLLFAKGYIKSNPHVLDKMVYYGSQTNKEGIINGLTAMRDRPDQTAVLAQAKVPVLFLIGKKDLAVPIENSLNQTHLPNLSDIHIYEEVGHMGMFENKQATIDAIKGFVDLCI